MDLKIIYAFLFTILPVSELRVGLPLAISYALEKNIPLIFMFQIIVLLNILVIFFIFYFLDNLHHIFISNRFYEKTFGIFLRRFQKKIDKFERKYSSLGFFALVLFVAVPFPGTGAWSGCLLSWLLGLERMKSILAIASGVLIAGIIIFFGSLGIFSLF